MVQSKVHHNLWTKPIVQFWVLQNPLKNWTELNLTIPIHNTNTKYGSLLAVNAHHLKDSTTSTVNGTMNTPNGINRKLLCHNGRMLRESLRVHELVHFSNVGLGEEEKT